MSVVGWVSSKTEERKIPFSYFQQLLISWSVKGTLIQRLWNGTLAPDSPVYFVLAMHTNINVLIGSARVIVSMFKISWQDTVARLAKSYHFLEF